MSSVHAKVLIAVLLLIGAVGYLGFSGVSSGWVYLVDVDQFVAGSAGSGHRARIHGTVAVEGVDVQSAKLVARFTLQGTTGSLRVEYRGAVPDHFQAGREVVVEGRLDSAGIFQADVLMTKCASKYEERPRDAVGRPEDQG